MIIRALDANGDWKFGQGKQSYKVGQEAVMENIETRLYAFLNDCWFDMTAGIDWLRLLGDKNTREEIVLSARAVILQSYGVVRINHISVSVSAQRRMILQFNIDTIFTSQFNRTLEVFSG